MNYYEILGVDSKATSEEIKKAYKKLVLKFHPDKYKASDAKEKFQKIQEAYDILSDNEKRRQYDSVGHDAFKNNFQGGAGFSGGFGFNDFGDINDILKNMFSGGGFGFGEGSAYEETSYKGEDLRYKIEISLEEAFTGIKKNITLPKKVKCSSCSGLGYDSNSKVQVCSSCSGKGSKIFQQGPFHFQQTCDICHGKGKSYIICSSCKGDGRVDKEVTILIDIPCGVEDSVRLKYPKDGNFGSGKNGQYGDLWIFIHVKKHNIFQVEGSNLIMNIPISVFSAIVGAEFDVPGIDKEVIKVNVPEGLQTDQILTIAGKGMSYYNKSKRGDLLLKFKFEIPQKLSSEDKEICRSLNKKYENRGKSSSFWGVIASYWR